MDAGLPRQPLTRCLRDAAVLGAAKLGLGAAVLASGFRAISDDDYARVVIAEQWAHAARLDPSGTSWLPVPFWINGVAMLVFGRGLGAARGVALLSSALAVGLVYFAATWLGASRRGALCAAALAGIFRWSALLGAAMVPELLTAALTLLGVASATRDATPARRALGGLALLAACLSRYEAWPVALGVVALSLYDALRDRKNARGALLGAALAASGPLLWMLWNRLAHGDALHFFARVAAYKRALGDAADEPLTTRLLGYPLALFTEAPELLAGVVVALGFALHAKASLKKHVRALFLAVFLIVALSLARVKDGAPTHHPERALLVVLLILATLAGDALGKSERVPLLVRVSGVFLPLLLVSLLATRQAVAFIPRADEVAIGEEARSSSRVLIEVVDYGHLAIVAAFGRPEDAVLDRSIDPRDAPTPDSFEDETRLQNRLAESGATSFVAKPSAVAERLGTEPKQHGAWAVWKVR